MTDFSHALEIATALPEAERVQLVDALIDSLAPADAVPLSDAWLTEIDRRSIAYDAGGLTTAPWQTVRDRVRQRVRTRVSSNE
ncbi:MAG: addiction module protein [Planctomycetia bacterium]|nr:addiction module protein [Planctomycetia bacterium]